MIQFIYMAFFRDATTPLNTEILIEINNCFKVMNCFEHKIYFYRRNCIGQNFAMAEMKSMVGKILAR